MSAHAAHRMHANSLATYREEEPKLSRRALAVLAWITAHGDSTDREVAYGMGFGENLNAVRPRITELVHHLPHAKLEEVAHVTCPVTRKTVRKVGLPRQQQALFS